MSCLKSKLKQIKLEQQYHLFGGQRRLKLGHYFLKSIVNRCQIYSLLINTFIHTTLIHNCWKIFFTFSFYHNSVHRLTTYILKTKVIKQGNTGHKTYVRHVLLTVNSVTLLWITFTFNSKVLKLTENFLSGAKH